MIGKKAISLISGGLDSLLATKIILQQGIHVEGVYFATGFHSADLDYFVSKGKANASQHPVLKVARILNIKIHFVNVIDEYRHLLLDPTYGYGKNFNPCLDCKIFMIRKAHQMMNDLACDFIITGEVLGQRAKSQLKHSMNTVLKDVETNNSLLRPLSAKLLAKTIPEIEGWVHRDALLDWTGKSRKKQFSLAKSYGFDDFAKSGGGCLLTEKLYVRKLKDHLEHNNDCYTLDELILLKIGRHLRLDENNKMIISRDMQEGIVMEEYINRFMSMQTPNCSGPIALVDGNPDLDTIKLMAQIVAFYSKGRLDPMVDVQIRKSNGKINDFKVVPLDSDVDIKKWNITS